jgi:four helix bundle protein
MRNFRQLEVWSQAIELVTKVYEVTNSFPQNERYGLVSQMNRCAISVPANIAEGSSRKTAVDFARFLEISLGSSFELETYFEIAYRLNFITEPKYEMVKAELSVIQKRINSLREAILSKD